MKPKVLHFIFIGCLILLFGVNAAGHYLARKQIVQKTMALQAVLAETEAESGHIDQLLQLKKQFLALQPKFTKLELSLPRVKKQSEIILQIQKLASDAGMTIPSTSFSTSTAGLPSQTSQTVAAGEAQALPITFATQGSYDQFKKFLRSLESLNRYTNITSMIITRGKTSNVYTIGLNVYVKP